MSTLYHNIPGISRVNNNLIRMIINYYLNIFLAQLICSNINDPMTKLGSAFFLPVEITIVLINRLLTH